MNLLTGNEWFTTTPESLADMLTNYKKTISSKPMALQSAVFTSKQILSRLTNPNKVGVGFIRISHPTTIVSKTELNDQFDNIFFVVSIDENNDIDPGGGPVAISTCPPEICLKVDKLIQELKIKM